MSSKFHIDADAVRELAKLLQETDLTEIEYRIDDNRIRVARQGIPMIAAHAAVSSAASQVVVPASEKADPLSHPGAVKSPMVGTAYLAPQPGAAPFISVGSSVTEGQTLLIVEAMKVMNPIRAPKSGKVVEILAKDGMPVEYGEVLLIIE